MIFRSGLSTPEAPVLLPDRSWLVTEMGPDRGCVTHISADGNAMRVVAKTGRPNGLAVDRDGVIWVAESLDPPALLRLTLDGQCEIFLTECDGEPFVFPNDLAFGPDGGLYMTDSGIAINDFAQGNEIRPDYKTAPYDGRVYRIDTKSRSITKIDAGILFTNGLAFGPDDNLYVAETISGNVYVYPRKGDGTFGPRRKFANVLDPKGPDVVKGPDGMKFGQDGNLYVTVYGQGDVTVLNPAGQVIRRYPTSGQNPSNLAFGPPGDRRIYITEDELGNLEAIEVDTDGMPLYT